MPIVDLGSNSNLDAATTPICACLSAASTPAPTTRQGVDRGAGLVRRANCSELGFAVERQPRTVGRRSGRARDRGRAARKVMLLGHADTVYPTGPRRQRPVTIVGDKLHRSRHLRYEGRLADRTLCHARARPAGWNGLRSITFIIVSDEEIEKRHSVRAAENGGTAPRRGPDPRSGPGERRYRDGPQSDELVEGRGDGKSAHAGVEPEKGRSATLALANVIVETFKLNGMKEGMTVNPGRIEGGSPPNMVADHARGVFDLRAWSTADLEELISGFRRTSREPWVPGVESRSTPSSAPACRRWSGRRGRYGWRSTRSDRRRARLSVEGRENRRWFRRELRLPRRARRGWTDSDRSAGSTTVRTNTSCSAASCRESRCWRSCCRRSETDEGLTDA